MYTCVFECMPECVRLHTLQVHNCMCKCVVNVCIHKRVCSACTYIAVYMYSVLIVCTHMYLRDVYCILCIVHCTEVIIKSVQLPTLLVNKISRKSRYRLPAVVFNASPFLSCSSNTFLLSFIIYAHINNLITMLAAKNRSKRRRVMHGEYQPMHGEYQPKLIYQTLILVLKGNYELH